MICYCSAKVSNPKPKTCTDCLIANKIIVGCGQGLKPCGDSTTINLNTYNHNPSDAVYKLSLNPYSSADFSEVTLTEAGVLTVTTGTAYTAYGLHVIKYEVTRGKYKDFGTIEICFDNPCEDGCSNCNTCSGECYGSTDDVSVTIDCSATGNTYNAATGLNLASCDGSNTWTVESDDEITATINSAGLITYDATSLALPGVEYEITWKVTCSLYGMTESGKVKVLIEDKCIGVTCDPGQTCNKCTGECETPESNMGLITTAFGAQ